jgi:hypothetical protein
VNQVDASWGQILGAGEYRLYRRIAGAGDQAWNMVYAGADRHFTDTSANGTCPCAALPGGDAKAAALYEYAVAAVNGNGEGTKGDIADTDPNSWRNWWPPDAPPRFMRQSAYFLPPYVSQAEVPPPYYP